MKTTNQKNSARRRAAVKGKKQNLHLRNLKSIRYNDKIQPPSEFVEFATSHIIPKLNITGYKTKQKHQTAIKCLFQLVRAGLMEHTIADSRNHANIGHIRVSMWDSIFEAGLAIKCIGSEDSGQVTRYYAEPALLAMYDNWPPKMLKEEPDDCLIKIKDGQLFDEFGKPLPTAPNSIQSVLGWYEAAWDDKTHDIKNTSFYDIVKKVWTTMENGIERINNNNLQHTWQAFKKVKGVDEQPRLISFQPNVCYRLINSKAPFRALRLYTTGAMGAQSLGKELRKMMLIDKEPVVELDFKGHHIRMLYNERKLNCAYDPYQPDKIFPEFYSFPNISIQRQHDIRAMIKEVTMYCINCENLNQAIGATKQLLNKSPEIIQNIVYKVEKSGAKNLLTRIQKTHTPIAKDFFCGRGIELMTDDGMLMFGILWEFVKAGKPALGIHDSLVVKRSDLNFTKTTMINCYEQNYPGFRPVVE